MSGVVPIVVHHIRFASNDPGMGLNVSGTLLGPGVCAWVGNAGSGLLESKRSNGAGGIFFVVDRAKARLAGG